MNVRQQFLAILRTFELLLHFDQLFFSNLQSGAQINYAPIINRIIFQKIYILCLKNDKIVTDILKRPENKKKIKKVRDMV